MSHKEAVTMKIITVVTLCYLPATFVSVCQLLHDLADENANLIQTFFSTDIVKYQTDSSNDSSKTNAMSMGSFSALALTRWFQVTIPLTFLTLLAGWIALKSSGRTANYALADAQMPTRDDDSKVILSV